MLNFLVETVWSLVSRQVTALEAPQFNISGNTTNLVYVQMVTCFGLYYSPLLPLITTVILILTFYIQQLSLKINFTDSKKTWTTSTTRTIYLIITFLAVIIPTGFFLFSMTQLSCCGPFAAPSPIDVTGINRASQDSTYFGYWILSRGVWAMIALASAIFFYYSVTSAQESRGLGKALLRELNGELKELRVLQRQAARVIVRDT